MRSRTYRWFVEPVGAQTNYDIAQLIHGTEAEELEIGPHDTEDGHRHLVYECTAEQRRSIEATCKESGLQAYFWKREGNGKYRRWDPKAIRQASRRNKEKKKPLLFLGTLLKTRDSS